MIDLYHAASHTPVGARQPNRSSAETFAQHAFNAAGATEPFMILALGDIVSLEKLRGVLRPAVMNAGGISPNDDSAAWNFKRPDQAQLAYQMIVSTALASVWFFAKNDQSHLVGNEFMRPRSAA